MSQERSSSPLRLRLGVTIGAAATLAAVAFPAAAGADGLTTPHVASAPAITTPKAAPSAPTAPGPAIGVSPDGPATAPSGDGSASAPAPGDDLSGNPFKSPGPAPATANPKSPDDLNGNPFQLTEQQRLEMDIEAAANFFNFTDSSGSNQYRPEEPEPFPPGTLFGILPVDLGGPVYNFLQITEQIEDGDHNGARS